MVLSAPVLFECKPVFTLDLPFGQQIRLLNHRFEPRRGSSALETTILTGLHGDELDGGYICHLLSQFLQRLPTGWSLRGIVNILPNANPLGTSLGQRSVPVLGSDLNRNFPGDPQGNEIERLAASIYQLAVRSTVCVDIHSSNSFLEELPQTRVVHEPQVLKWAGTLGLDVIWSHSAHNWIPGTIAKALFSRGIHTLVVEVGTGRRLNRVHCERVFRGLLQFLQAIDVLSGQPAIYSAPQPLYATEANVIHINAEVGGLFVPHPALALGTHLHRGARLGQVINTLSGEQTDVTTPIDGHLFTLRVHPVVYAGSLVARLIHV